MLSPLMAKQLPILSFPWRELSLGQLRAALKLGVFCMRDVAPVHASQPSLFPSGSGLGGLVSASLGPGSQPSFSVSSPRSKPRGAVAAGDQ